MLQNRQNSSESQRKNILYISKYCQWSKKFREALQKTPLFNKFVQIYIDTPGVKYPPWLQRVPTIQIYDQNRKRQILTDKHAFEWLNQYCDAPVDLAAYNEGGEGMSSSLSDCFAFLDKSKEATHNFSYLDTKN